MPNPAINISKPRFKCGRFLSYPDDDNILLTQNVKILFAVRRKLARFVTKGVRASGKFLNYQRRNENEMFRKRKLCRKKKTASSFEGDISSVSMTDETPREELVPGPSVPRLATSCDATLKSLLKLWTR